MIKKLRLLALLTFITSFAFGQASSGGEIYGRVVDDQKNPLDFATVQAFEGGVFKGGAKTDEQGNFKIKPLTPGTYSVKVSYSGYIGEERTKVIVGNDKRTNVEFKLEKID